MLNYIFRRLLLIIPTLLGIMVLNFTIVQIAPGGPIDRAIAELRGLGSDPMGRLSGAPGEAQHNSGHQEHSSNYAGAQGLDPEFIKDLERQFGFDKPPTTRFLMMMKNFATFNLGTSYFKGRKVTDLILEKMPVSISLGLWSTLIIYLVSLPLGIRKAVQDGSRFDIWTSSAIVVGYAVPAFLFAIFLIIVFAGGSFYKIFPLRGLTSDGWALMSVVDQIKDYFWHITLPVIALTISGFASLTLLTKNSFISEIHKSYVVTARAKGCSETRTLYGHIFRNGMLIVIAGMPATFMHLLFTGALLIEVIFSLDGLGLLGFEAAMSRDYPVMFGTLYLFTLLSLLLHIIGDLIYMVVDPRIDFDKRET